MDASFVVAAPPAASIAAEGLLRSMIVYDRRPSWVPIEHELGPSGIHRESFGNVYSPWTQIPYWPPC
jgi:hypothetical protein